MVHGYPVHSFLVHVSGLPLVLPNACVRKVWWSMIGGFPNPSVVSSVVWLASGTTTTVSSGLFLACLQSVV